MNMSFLSMFYYYDIKTRREKSLLVGQDLIRSKTQTAVPDQAVGLGNKGNV